MNEQRFKITDLKTAQNAGKALSETGYSNDKPIELIIRPYKKIRSLSSNALSHVWYPEIARERGETPEQVRCECKLRFGVPILRAEDETFRLMYDQGIKNTFSYEDKRDKVMKILPVTSLMSSEQMNYYLRDLQMTMAQDENIILMTPMESEYFKWSQEI